MNATIRTLVRRPGAHAAAVTLTAALCGGSLLLAACSTGASSAGGSSSGFGSARTTGPDHRAPGLAGSPAVPAPAQERVAGKLASGRAARLVVPGQSIIYTAGLVVRTRNVTSAASLATSIVTAAGGYVASEQSSVSPGAHARSTVRLRFKIPVAAYPATLRQLSGRLGSQLSLSQQAQDVTGQVADVTSRVASARAAIEQLRALLRRAGSVGSLLGVQEEINAEESALEALQAQQRALSRETTYATVSLQLLSKHAPAVIHKKHSRGFVAGLSAGWRAFVSASTWLFTAAGTVLPFALLAALLAGLGYGGRRRLQRRKSRPSTAG